MTFFAEGQLFNEICQIYRGESPWFWKRDILRQAEARGYLRIVAHTEELPFWWRTFEQATVIDNEKLKALLREETSWKGCP
jgi:hypothetical protein